MKGDNIGSDRTAEISVSAKRRTHGANASVLCGVIGVIIIEKKLVMMSGGISHASYGGVGLGYLRNQAHFWSYRLCAAVGTGRRFCQTQEVRGADVLIGLFWSLGMALGIFLINADARHIRPT